jgi:glycosyltransferase involved in cell wall biosynthesis
LHPLDSVWLSLLAQRLKPAVYFTPGFNPPLYARCPVVFVIHDLIHLHFPAESSATKRLYYEVVVKRAARRAAVVLTVSECSKAEIIEWAGVPADRIRVVGNGVSEAFTAEGLRHVAERPYLLFVGNRKPHKNLPRVLEAFAQSSLAPAGDLYVNGDPDSGTCGLIEELRIGPHVRFVGTVSDAELGALYRGALGLVTPSLYEGFGLPAIEAAACGCPVIAGNQGAQAEVMGGSALLVDPACVEEGDAVADGRGCAGTDGRPGTGAGRDVQLGSDGCGGVGGIAGCDKERRFLDLINTLNPRTAARTGPNAGSGTPVKEL